MTLTERNSEQEIIYQDNEWLIQSQWAKMLGVHTTTLHHAMNYGDARIKTRYGGIRQDRHYRLTPVEDFPKIITGLGQSKRREKDHVETTSYPWAAETDTSINFEITTASGIITSLSVSEQPNW